MPRKEFKSPSLNKDKSTLKLQNSNYVHILAIREELEFIQGSSSYSDKAFVS